MGSVVISMEVGPRRPDDDGVREERYRETLSAWRRASYCFDRHEVPATWLVAGHLFEPDRRTTHHGGWDGTVASRRAADGERAGTPHRSGDGVSPNEMRRDSSEQSSDGVSSNEERRGSSGERSESDGVSSSEGRRDAEGPVGDRQGAGQGPGEEPNASPCVRPDHSTDPLRSNGDSTADRTRSTRSAPDLIEAIRRSRVAHEIGCQPFTRLDIDDAGQDEAVAAVRACIDAAAQLGVRTERLRAFAFPDDRMGHRDVLAAYGFACYRAPRSTTTGWLSSLRTWLWLVGRRLARTGPPLVEPETDEHGLVALPTSMPLFPLAGRARTTARAARGDPVAALVKRGVDRVVDSERVLHLQLRPEDLRTETDFERLETVLAHVAARRAETDLRVETMGGVARRVAREMPPRHLDTVRRS